MAVHLAVEGDPNKYWPQVYCGSPGSVRFTRTPSEASCTDCALAHIHAKMDEKRPLGLHAVFYDGETRPVAGFVLEQDAERHAKEYSGGASYEIKRVHVMTDEEREALEALVAYRRADAASNAYHDGSPLPGSEPPFSNDGLRTLAGKVRLAVDKVIAARAYTEE